MTMKRTLAIFLAVITILTLFASCGKENRNEDAWELYEPETAEASDPDLQSDYTADAETVAYLDALKKTFLNLPASPAADFKTAETDGGVAVTDYLGEDRAVRIPDQFDGKAVVAVSDAAFADCKTLEKLYIPDTVRTYGEGVLKGCSSLKALHAPLPQGEDAYLGYLFGSSAYTDNARDIPSSLAYFELGGTMTELPAHALFDCNDLVLVTLPAGVTAVGAYALYNCESLLALDVSGIKTLSEHALDSCAALTRLDFGEALTTLGFGALQGCDELRRLTLPFVGDGGENAYLGYAFGAEVPDFAKGFYPPYLSEITLLAQGSSLGDYAFFECETLTRVNMCEGVRSIGVRAFAGCTRLTSIALPASLESIRENAFFGCISLETISFAEGSALKSIGINAFYKCGQLKEIALPDSLKSLPASCFADCFSLCSVDLGGVTAVGKNAFHRCTRLASATIADNAVIENGNTPLDRLIAPKG